MVIFHDLAAQLKSFCSTSGREPSRAPAQVIDSEVCPVIPWNCCFKVVWHPSAAKVNPHCCRRIRATVALQS